MYITGTGYLLAQSSFPTVGKSKEEWSIFHQLIIIRAMLHDEDAYPEPFEFKPDRFMKDGKLDPDVRDPGHAAFGFGRR